MENAFAPGDPVLDLAALGKGLPDNVLQGDDQHWIRHAEQKKIDGIINGTTQGHYHLLIGEKGTMRRSLGVMYANHRERYWKVVNAVACNAKSRRRGRFNV